MSDDINLTEEDVEAAKSDAEKYRNTLALLAENDGFKVLQTIIRKQVQARKEEIATMAIYDDKTIAQRNILVGEITGLQTAMLLPSNAVKQIELERLMNQEKENKNGNK